MSLRRRLLITLGLSFTILWILAAAWMYANLHQRMVHALDQRLAASARMVAGLVAQMPEGEWRKAGTPILSMPKGHGVACRISSRHGHVLLRTSGGFGKHLNALPVGFTDRIIDGRSWRLFTMVQNGLHITTADRLDERHILLRNVLLVAAVPFAVALLGSLLALWLGLVRGLRPLDRLRRELSERAPDTLTPVEVRGAPPELVPAIETLNRLLSRTSEVLERERRFTSDAAHELRTPLTAIKTHVQLASRVDAERAQKALCDAETGIARLQHTLEQLLLLSRVEANEAGDNTASSELTTIVAAARADLLASDRIVLDGEQIAQVAVRMPQALAVTALRNLLDNALQYSADDTQVVLKVTPDVHVVTLTVADRGSWPADGDPDNLTQRFWRSPGNRGRHATGSGLGLALVQAIVTRFDGRLDFTARQGGGLVATLVLPIDSV